MKSSSLRRVVVAMTIAVSAATVHGAWFSTTDATTEGASIASVRLSHWDHYQQKWLSTVVVSGETLRNSEGAIIEMRPLGAGDAVSLSGVGHDVLDANDLASLGIPQPTADNTVLDGSQAVAPVANGTASYLRLRVSTLSNNPQPPNGHVGPWSGPTDPTPADLAATDVGGSVGIHGVTLTTNTDAVSFTWDISRWAKGDVFLGLNEASYKVIDREGNFKRFVATADYLDSRVNDYTLTTGCATNWKTGEVFATNFGEGLPAINVITRHPDAGLDPIVQYSPASRRFSTKVVRPDQPDNYYGIDQSPESVVFDGNLNMYVGNSFGSFSVAPAGWATDPSKKFEDEASGGEYTTDVKGLPLEGWLAAEQWGYLVDENGVRFLLAPEGSGGPYTQRIYGVEVSARMNYNAGQLVTAPEANPLGLPDWQANLPTGFLSDPTTGLPLVTEAAPTTKISYRWPMGKRLHRYNNTNNLGVYSGADRDAFWTFTGRQGTDWIDLDVSGEVMYYTSEDAFIHRFNVKDGVQLPDVGADLASEGKLLGGNNRFHGLRILPPGDGTGGFLVATKLKIARFSAAGEFVQQYTVHDDPYLSSLDDDGGRVAWWYTLEVDPGGRSFWASAHDTGWVYQFDIATGLELKRMEAVKYRPNGHMDGGRRVEGICVMWEYTAPQEICFKPDGTPDGVDNDLDGFIDENCQRLEICTVNGTDQDGDNLPDSHDPDCGVEAPPTAEPDFYTTDQNVSLAVPSVGTLVVLNNDTDPDNGVEGEPWRADTLTVAAYGAATSNLAPGTPLVTAAGTVTLASDGSFLFDPAATFHGQFTFVYSVTDGASTSAPTTVTIYVRPLVANDTYTTTKNTPLTGNNVLANDSAAPMMVSAAGPGPIAALTGLSITFPTANGGTVVLNADGTFSYTPSTGFVGDDSFVYLGNDGTSSSVSTATVTITVTAVPAVLTVVTSPNPSVYGKKITVTATIRCGAIAKPSVGTATFLRGTTVIASGVGVNDGKAEIEIPAGPLAVGTYVMDVQYSGVPGQCTVSTGTTTHEVIPAPLEIKARQHEKVYGTTFTFTGTEFDVTGLLFGDTVTSVTLTSAGAPASASVAGSVYVVTPSSAVGSGLANYSIEYKAGELKVTKAALTITANNISKVYGTLYSFAGSEFTRAGLANADTVTSVTLESDAASASKSVGTGYEIKISNAVGTGLANYVITYVKGAMTVTPAPLTVTATDKTKAAGTPNPVLDGTGVGVVAGDAISWTYNTTAGLTSPVGTYPITPTIVASAGLLSNYAVTLVNGTLTVTPGAELVITASPRTKVYGSAVVFAGTEFVVSGLLPGTSVTSVTLSSAGAAASATVAGGPYIITPSAAVGTGLENYLIRYVTGPLTVTPAPLMITSNNRSKNYGQAVTLSSSAFTAAGLVNGDKVDSVTSTSAGTPAGAGVAGSPYAIIPSAAAGTGLANYAITYVNGTLTVSPLALEIKARKHQKIYGTTFTFTGTEFDVTGLIVGDTVTSVTLTSPGAPAMATVAGSVYAVTPSAAAGTGLANYIIEYKVGELDVIRAPLTLTATNLSKVYGTLYTFAGTEYSIAGLANADTVASVTLASDAAAASKAAGTVNDISIKDAIGVGLANYDLTYVKGAMTVTRAPLTITANNRSKVYGAVSTFAGTEFAATGLKLSDSVGSVALTSAGAPASATVTGGPYTIIPSNASGSGLANYAITYVDGVLTVTRKAATVTAGSGSKVVGSPDPVLTTSQTGFLTSDLTAITLQATRAAGETVNTYPTTATATGTPLSNYDVTYYGGAFTITNRAPVAQSDSAITNGTSPVAIAVLGNDSDPDGHSITISSYTQPAGGIVTPSGGVFTFTANVGFFGPTTFTYTITDGYDLTSTATVTVNVQNTEGAYRTQTQGGWGSSPSGDNPGAFLAANFTQVFASGYVQVGGSQTLRFTSAAAVEAFLEQSGKPAKLSASAVNPTGSAAGVFGGQVLALQISVSFSNAGVTRSGLGDMRVQSGRLAGKSVAEVLALANSVLGGGALPSGLTISDLNSIVDTINNNFVDGTTAKRYLR